MNKNDEIAIIGAGIGGLTLALDLHASGIPCRVYEAVDEIKPLGVGINILPHAVKELDRLGLLSELREVGVETKEAIFFNKHGQFVYSEPAGLGAGYTWPQFSIHRGDLQKILLDAVVKRLGADSVVTGHRCTGYSEDADSVTVTFEGTNGEKRDSVRAPLLIACDGIHSVVRKKLYPDEGTPRYSGVNMWRGTVVGKPYLTGASMVRAGWLTVGKMVIYPIRNNVDGNGNQLLNWVAEIECPLPAQRDWSRKGRLEDFFPTFSDWSFEWLDVADMIKSTEQILEYPMVDQEPLPRWSFGRVTLLGDAAHPMVPRGSNGAGQAILDVPSLVEQLKKHGLNAEALTAYEEIRRKATTDVVLMNRKAPPDAILKRVHELTDGQPFTEISDVISKDELAEISNAYKNVVGLNKDKLNKV